jgi:hypothetical protein
MSDDALRKRLIRLAQGKPELRPHLLPLLRQSAVAGPIESFYKDLVRRITARPRDVDEGIDHWHLEFAERFSGGRISFYADIYEKNGKVWLTVQGERKKHSNPREAAKAIEEERDLRF